jgi:sulfonate dioxygenase
VLTLLSQIDRELTPIYLQPSFPELTLPPLGDIPVTDRGHFADAKKANLYAEAAAQGGSVKHHTPVLGVEFKGVSLKQLSKKALDDLALLIAERGVVGEFARLWLQGC